MGLVASISPCLLMISMFPPVVGFSRLRALASSRPVVMFPVAWMMISPDPSGERELIVSALVSIVPLLLLIVIFPATPWVASPSGMGIRVKLLLTGISSLTNPDARLISPVSIVFSAIKSILPVSPSFAPLYILAVVVLMLLPASKIMSPPWPGLSVLLLVEGSEADMILLFSMMLILPPALSVI